MNPTEIMGLLTTAQTLLPSALNLLDVIKKLSTEVSIEDVEKLRLEVAQAVIAEDAALKRAQERENLTPNEG